MLDTQEGTGQGFLTALVRAGVGLAHHAAAQAWAQVTGAGPIQTCTTNQTAGVVQIPTGFGEQANIVELGIFHPILIAVVLHAHATAFAMAAAHQISTCGQGQVFAQGPVHAETAAPGQAIHIGGHRHGHATTRFEGAQPVVVHNVIGVVVVELGLHIAQHAFVHILLETQTQGFTLEFRTIHATTGVAGITVTRTCA